jgi:hypothetical protein
MWPARDAICLDCRTALPAGQRCHTVRSLRDPAERDALLETVWGPKTLRRNLRDATRAGAIGGTSAWAFDGCSSCDATDLGGGEALVVLLVVFFAIVVIWLIVRYAVDRHRQRSQILRAKGALRGPRFTRGGPQGVIRATTTEPDPISGEQAVAFGVELRSARGVMLRDGATLGFELDLDSGERIAIPAGACVIDLAKATRTKAPELYISRLDPLRADGDDLDPFPASDAKLVVLRPGDRVELHSPLTGELDPTKESGYRDAATRLAITGVPRLRRV